jgi:integrase/recombinase XerD
VLYATGLRVSELIGLEPDDLDLDLGILTCFGKGRKERLVPLGSVARGWVRRYLEEVRPGLGKRSRAPNLFLNHRGGRLSRMGLWGIVRRHAVRAGVERTLTPTSSGTRSPPTSWSGERTSGPSRPCWATPTSRRRRSTPTSRESAAAVYDQFHPRA